ncbi:MAG: ABC transporter permease [Acidobacteriota bacterium]|nr:ABC transporter permease [Acidobacteriota bacterium]
MTSEEARRRARLEFGGLDQVKEECRDVGAARLLETLVQDLRYGVRQLRRNRGFTAVAVATLALGIGATTAIFSVVNSVLIKPLPYPHPQQLVSVLLNAPGANWFNVGLGPSDYFTYRDRNRTLQDIGLYKDDRDNVTGVGQPERVRELEVTDDLLPILGIPPLLGRWFDRQDGLPSSPRTAMLTYGYWESKFGGDPKVVGRTIVLDGEPYQIIGVMPRRFHFLDQPDPALILPLRFNRNKTNLGDFDYESLARLKPAVTIAEANADEARMIPIVLRAFPPPPGLSLELFKKARFSPDVVPLKQAVVGDLGKLLWVVMAGMGMVLLIACANVASLLLVRTEGRRQELAIRAALGASPGRTAGGLLIESLVLSSIGGALGLLFALGALWVLAAMAPAGLSRLNEIGVDGMVVLFTLAASLAASLLFGSVPVFKYAGAGVGIGLHEVGRILGQSRQQHRLQNALVSAQIGLAFVLLVCSGLMIRTFRAIAAVKPGFSQPDQVQAFTVHIPDTDVHGTVNVVRAEQEIADKIAALPSVMSVGLSSSAPMSGNDLLDPVFAKDRTYAQGKIPPLRHFIFVSPGYFHTMGIPLITGRDVTWRDTYNMNPVALVSENFAHEYWGAPTNALGKSIRVNGKDEWRQVIGVVGNVHNDGMTKAAPTCVYWPVLNAKFMGEAADVQSEMTFAVRSTRAGSESLMNEIRRAVWSVDPNLPLFEVHTLDYYYSTSMARTSFTLVMLTIAGSMALLLGIVGLYGVIAYLVSQRTHEIGIRMALGAQRRDLLRHVLGQGMSLSIIGVFIGVVAGLGLTRFLAGLLYGVKPTDPLTFAAVALILLGVALIACYIPARRATKVDPMVALRHE